MVLSDRDNQKSIFPQNQNWTVASSLTSGSKADAGEINIIISVIPRSIILHWTHYAKHAGEKHATKNGRKEKKKKKTSNKVDGLSYSCATLGNLKD